MELGDLIARVKALEDAVSNALEMAQCQETPDSATMRRWDAALSGGSKQHRSPWAVFTVNDRRRDIRGFSVICKACGGADCEIILDWAGYAEGPWCNIQIACSACGVREFLYDSQSYTSPSLELGNNTKGSGTMICSTHQQRIENGNPDVCLVCEWLEHVHSQYITELKYRIETLELQLTATAESLRRANQQCATLRAENEPLRAGGNVDAR